VITVPTEAVTAPISVTLTAKVALAAPGDYRVRARIYYAATSGAVVAIDTVPLAPREAVLIGPVVTVKERDSPTQSVSFTVDANTACSIRLELVDPSGDAEPLPGNRLYSEPAGIATLDGTAEALELMALAGALAKQWKLSENDLPALVRLHQGNADFPAFPPTGTTVVRRPLEVNDSGGFVASVEYARIVAAVRMARGEGRQILFETALL
jgi:hypothetical protein